MSTKGQNQPSLIYEGSQKNVGPEEKKYWYDGKFHETPPDSVKIKKVNLQKKTTTSSGYQWVCEKCERKGNTRNGYNTQIAKKIFGTNIENITGDNEHGFYKTCLECRLKKQRDDGECKFIIKKYERGELLFPHHLIKLGEYFRKYPKEIKKYQKTFEYVSEKLEERRAKKNESAKDRSNNDPSFTFYDSENKDE